MAGELLQAIEDSDAVRASNCLNEELGKGMTPWEIHLSLFPVVQRVLNPPFINPHLPKMHRICREFIPYLEKDEIRSLVRLEVNEYARRPKLDELPRTDLLPPTVSFEDIEAAIREQNWHKTASSMLTFCEQEGKAELVRRLLLLGSGYLGDSLGHSISCTAFILLEMLERLRSRPVAGLIIGGRLFLPGPIPYDPHCSTDWFLIPSDEDVEHHLLRATSGQGIINLHHTITLYAIERIRPLVSDEEHNQMVGAWVAFMGDKKANPVRPGRPGVENAVDYEKFYEPFSRLEVKSVVASLQGLIASEQGRKQLGRFLIRGLCDRYQGNYNPHYLTGLGSTLWVIDRYWSRPAIAINALSQYVDFLFEGLRSDNERERNS